MIQPAYLQAGDCIAITATARSLEHEQVKWAVKAIENAGFVAKVSATIGSQHSIFAGNDQMRLAELQDLLDHPAIKAIWCARGGYGSIRLIDKIDWTGFRKHPKWLIGFSDITNLHLVIQAQAYSSIHAEMPLRLNADYEKNESVVALFESLKGEFREFRWSIESSCQVGKATGKVLGGNLATLISHIGTPSFPDLSGKILFIEEVGEYLYRIERMLFQLKRSCALRGLKAVIVGDFTDLFDNETPFDKTWQELILDCFGDLGIPIAFGFKAGHAKQNWPLVFGAEYSLFVQGEKWELKPI